MAILAAAIRAGEKGHDVKTTGEARGSEQHEPVKSCSEIFCMTKYRMTAEAQSRYREDVVTPVATTVEECKLSNRILRFRRPGMRRQ